MNQTVPVAPVLQEAAGDMIHREWLALIALLLWYQSLTFLVKVLHWNLGTVTPASTHTLKGVFTSGYVIDYIPDIIVIKKDISLVLSGRVSHQQSKPILRSTSTRTRQ